MLKSHGTNLLQHCSVSCSCGDSCPCCSTLIKERENNAIEKARLNDLVSLQAATVDRHNMEYMEHKVVVEGLTEAYETQIKELRTDNLAHQNNIESHQKKINNVYAQLIAANDVNNQMKSRRSALDRQLYTVTNLYHTQQSHLDRLTVQNRNQQTQIDNQDVRINALQSENRTLVLRCDQHDVQINAVIADNKLLQNQNKALMDYLDIKIPTATEMKQEVLPVDEVFLSEALKAIKINAGGEKKQSTDEKK